MRRRNDKGEVDLYGFVAALVVIVCIGLVLFLLIGGFMLVKGIGRSQARSDAKNRVKISTIEIQNQAQRVEIAKQKAAIRLQDAIGVREAQDQIAKTLTPLYVQFEMVEAIKQIAASGSNSSVIYIPSGPGGIPIVDDVSVGKVGEQGG